VIEKEVAVFVLVAWWCQPIPKQGGVEEQKENE